MSNRADMLRRSAIGLMSILLLMSPGSLAQQATQVSLDSRPWREASIASIATDVTRLR